MNDFIKIIKSLEDSCLFIDEVTETVKLEIRRQEDGFLEALLPPLAVSLAQPVFFSVVKDKSRRGVRRSGYIDEKRIYRWKVLVPLHPLNNTEITNYFEYEPRFNGVFLKNQFT